MNTYGICRSGCLIANCLRSPTKIILQTISDLHIRLTLKTTRQHNAYHAIYIYAPEVSALIAGVLIN